MVHRWLDVVFEWASWFGIALFLIPTTIGILAFVGDRSQIVTAKIWANHPALLRDAVLSNEWSNGTPASDADALLTELLSSNWFASEVLQDADSGFAMLSPGQQEQRRLTLRQNLKHQTEGTNLLSISYVTDHPEAGRALVSSVVTNLANAVESVESVQSSAVVRALTDQAASAYIAMQRAIDAVNAYAAGKSESELLQDSRYQTLVIDARTETDFYVSIENKLKEAELQQAAIPTIRNAIFREVDPPAVSPKQFDLHTPAVKYFLAAMCGTAGVEILVVYVIGLRDPRVRSGDEVRRLLGIPYLGSTPTFRPVQ